MRDLTSLGEERFEGEDCYVVRGAHPHHFNITMWIGKRDFLLRKTRKMNRDGSYAEEIRRGVILNGEIPPETFNYTPAAKRRPGDAGQD